MKLEICAYSVTSAVQAERAGADRIELCAGLLEGGTTPSWGTIATAKRLLQIPVFPIIRPRGGDFCYDEFEFEVMCQDVAKAKALDADGVVIGILTEEGDIDQERMRILIELAKPMQVTCHRAFDMVRDPARALEQLIALGVDRVLTSGQANTAPEGVDAISRLVAQAAGRISIMPGSGVRPENIAQLQTLTGANEFHSSASTLRPSRMRYQNTEVNMSKESMASEFLLTEVDEEAVAKMRQALDDKARIFAS